MLDYIKKQIQARQPGIIQTSPEPEDVPNDVIVEYAKLFQELDDISDEGTDTGKERKLGIDIPLEDDVEIENIEFNLSDGRVTDVPGDATVTESYETMKTYNKFYEEAEESTVRLPRESDASYNRRVTSLADQMYTEYCNDAERIGAFGFRKLRIDDDRVPSKLNVDFGPMSSDSDKSFMAKVKTFFATDDEHAIFKKQLDSVRLVQNGAFAKIGEPLMAYMESHYDVPSDSSVWDICTPKNLIVPKGNGDSFCVVLEYTNEITGNNEYFGWTKPVTIQESVSDDDKPYTIDEAKAELAKTRKKLLNSSWKDRFDIKKIEPEFDKLEKEVLSKMKSSHNLMRVEQGSFYLFPKAWKDKKQTSGTEYIMKVSGGLGEEPHFICDKHDYDGHVVEGYVIADIDRMETINMESFVTETQYENKDQYIQEAANAIKEERKSTRRPLSRFYQEAIDFGGGEGDGGSDLPPAADDGGGSDTTGNDTPPAPDGGDSTGGSDQNVDSGNASDAPEANGDSDNKETAAVNDVSSEIAEKVADDTQDDANASNDDNNDAEITFDDDTSTGPDTNSEIDNEPSVDEQLDDLDNTSNGSDTSDDADSDMSEDTDIDTTDIDNMTIDELMEHGSDKLKRMPLNEIKKFLSSGTPEAVQESFIITKKNVDKEIDVNLRKCLGILNDKSISIDKLLRNFKMAGHKLNRVLTKAAKLKGAYSSDEVQSIQKLNKALVELMTSLKKSNTASYVSSVKRNILAFTSESKAVAAFVEDRLKGNTPVQESFLFGGNIKDKITESLIPVKTDMADLYEKHKSGQLTRGRIIKKYSSNAYGGGGRASNMGENTSYWTGYSKQAKNLNTCLKLLNKALRKNNVDNIDIIRDLADKLDMISDYIETVIDDRVENKEYVKIIGNLSGEIIELINQFIGDDSPDKTAQDSEDTTKTNDVDASASEETTFDDDTADSVEDTTGEETPDEGDSAPDAEGDEE